MERAVLLDVERSAQLDVQSVDALAELARQLGDLGIEPRLAVVGESVTAILERAGVAEAVTVWPTIGAAVAG